MTSSEDAGVIRRREPWEQARYLATQLRDGLDVIAVALALDVLADELEHPLVVVTSPVLELSESQVQEFREAFAAFRQHVPPSDPDLCRKCDVFIGYGALGVAVPPAEGERDREWLGSHCWVCCRSRDEIRAAGW